MAGWDPGPAQQPAALLFTDATGWHLALELPGVRADSLEVTWSAGTLRVEAERPPPGVPWHSVRLSEGRYGRLSRTFDVPDGYDPARAEAVLEQGLLRIDLPPRSHRRLRLLPGALRS